MRIKLTLLCLIVLLSGGHAVPAQATEGEDNGRITFGRFDPDLGDFSIWAANPDGTAQRRLTEVPSFFSDWSPDGRRIAYDFADETGVHIATMGPNGRRVRQLTSTPGIQEVPRWSPDGRRIVFDAYRPRPGVPFSTSIWIMRADGSQPRQLTFDGFDVEPVFSPDGTQIAFARITGETAAGDTLEAVYVMDVDGTDLYEVVAPTPGLEHPDWSPDGRWISFNIAPEAVTARGSGSVVVVRPDGSGLRILHRPAEGLRFFKPVWSPDGEELLTGCFDILAQVDKLCVLDADGRGVTIVVDESPDFVNFPAWGSHPPVPAAADVGRPAGR